jgi:hypothetical protein
MDIYVKDDEDTYLYNIPNNSENGRFYRFYPGSNFIKYIEIIVSKDWAICRFSLSAIHYHNMLKFRIA